MNGMEICTKKHFLELLCNNGSSFFAPARWKSDEWIVAAMDGITPEAVAMAPRRTVAEIHSQYIVFSGGSRLSFDQEGKYQCFTYRNKNGIYFAVQRHEYWDDFDGITRYNYIVYVIPDLCTAEEIADAPDVLTVRSGKTYNVVDHIPNGWETVEESAPEGYKWICNGEPLFQRVNGKTERNTARKTMLLRA